MGQISWERGPTGPNSNLVKIEVVEFSILFHYYSFSFSLLFRFFWEPAIYSMSP